MSKFQYLSSPDMYDNWTMLTESVGEWLEFYDEWWINGASHLRDLQQFHVAQPLVCSYLGITEHISLDKSLYDGLATISARYRDGVIIDQGGDLGLDAPQLRAFLLYRMAQQIPSFLTVDSEPPHTYMIDERGIFVLPVSDVGFKGGLIYSEVPGVQRPWALVDALNDSLTRKGPPSGVARRNVFFSVCLAHDRRYGFKRWGQGWHEHNVAGRFKTKELLQIYVDQELPGHGRY